MLGYKYNTIAEFEVDNELCNTYYGIPVDENSTTRNWLAYSISYTLEDEVDFYYIITNEPILGERIEITIRNKNESI